MRNKRLLLLLPLIVVASCQPGGQTSHTSSSSSTPVSTGASSSSSSSSSTPDPDLPPVGEDELGGGQYDDEAEVDMTDVSALKTLLEGFKDLRTYTYATTYNIDGATSQVVDHYGEHYFYEENLTDPAASFGLAEEADGADKNVFRFYVDEDQEGLDRYRASLYEYVDYTGDEPEPMTDLYGVFGIAGLNNISDTTLDELTGIKLSETEYLITSSSTYTIFQFMTQMGSSIASLMTECRLTITDPYTNSFRVTIGLGDRGSIVSDFTPLMETEYDDLDQALEDGTIQGVPYYQDIVTLYEGMLNQDNYTIHPTVTNQGGTFSTFDAQLTENYFLIDYTDTYNQQGYTDFGYMFVPAGVEIQLETRQADGTYAPSEVTSVPYSACYDFDFVDGQPHFISRLGPNETDTVKFVQVDTKEELMALPEEQRHEGWLYIVTAENVAYQWTVIDAVNDTYGFTPYTDWYDDVSDFYITNSATFYTSAATIGHIARFYMEKDPKAADTYYTTDASVLSTLGYGLFGFGFVPGDSWVSDVTRGETIIHRGADQAIDGCDIRLYANNPEDPANQVQMNMAISQIGTTSVSALDETFAALTDTEAR